MRYIVALLALCCALCFSGVHSEDIAISAPDIYPLDTDPVPELDVKLVAQAQQAVVRYTLDGSDPTLENGMTYTEPIHLFSEGKTTVKAIAISKTVGRGNSTIVSKTYTIKPSNIPYPVANPLPSTVGRARGTLRVALRVPSTESDLEVRYIVTEDDHDPGNRWLTYTEPFILDVGESVVQTRTVNTKTKEASSTGRYKYTVTPALSYDVMSSCSKCEKGIPVVGKLFTIYLQNAEEKSTLRLTTSQMGCKTGAHTLEDTTEVVTKLRKRQYSFQTNVEPKEKVWVCIKEPSANATVVVPRIKQLHRPTGESGDFFSIDSAVGAIVRGPVTPQPIDVELSSFSNQNTTNATGSFTTMLFMVIILALGVVAVKQYRRTTNAGGEFRRRGASDGAEQGSPLKSRQEDV